jgi:hypothetical protein
LRRQKFQQELELGRTVVEKSAGEIEKWVFEKDNSSCGWIEAVGF